MTEKQLIEFTRKAIEEFNQLPPEEQVRQMISWGTINENGEVLLGRNLDEDNQEPVYPERKVTDRKTVDGPHS